MLTSSARSVILVTIISAGSSNVYSGSRVMSDWHKLELLKVCSWTQAYGVPYVSVVTVALVPWASFRSSNSGKLYSTGSYITAVSGLIAWGFVHPHQIHEDFEV